MSSVPDPLAVLADHFLTLPNGCTITVPDGQTAWDVFTPHVVEYVGGGLCPWCFSPLDERLECRDPRHPACRWHACAEGIGQVMLDASEPLTCAYCQQEM